MTILEKNSKLVEPAIRRLSRRGFFTSLSRYSLLAALGILGVKLTFRQGITDETKTTCIKVPVCRDCRLFKNCALPRAKEERNKLG